MPTQCRGNGSRAPKSHPGHSQRSCSVFRCGACFSLPRRVKLACRHEVGDSSRRDGSGEDKDLDILLIMSEDFEAGRISTAAQAVFDSTRTKLLSDIFWARASIAQELLDLWPDTYRTPEPFESAILWNRCCHDSNGRPNAPRAAIRWQDYRRPDSVLSCDSLLPADDREPPLQATLRKRIRKLSRERRTHLTAY